MGELETRQLVYAETQERAGYIFPLTAFRDSENFDGTWLRRFADVGFRFAASRESISTFGAAVSIESLRNRNLFVDEVLDDTLSVIVIGNAAREKLGVDIDTLELMLFKFGVNVVRSRSDILPRAPAAEWSSRLRLSTPGNLVAAESSIFLSLLKSADRDQLGVGAFMHLYQTLEFCIDHIFSWRIEEIAREGLDTWSMKEQLSKITGGSHRLGLLDTKYLSALARRSCLNELSEGSRRFLTALGMEFELDAPWHKLLYKCRNIIVHNQMMMMKTANVPLQELVQTLRSASFEILFSFSKDTTAIQA